MIHTIINNQEVSLELPTGTVLLDVIRNNLKLKGTKEGCREGDCGSCIVLWGKLKNNRMDYCTVNSCMFPLGQADNSHIVTIEGLNGANFNPIQQAIIDENASQCGFCTPGFIISLTGYFLCAKTINIEDAIASLSGNICRCTGYVSIIRAVGRVCDLINPTAFENSFPDNRISFLVKNDLLPEYFLNIPQKLSHLPSPTHEIITITRILLGGGTDLYVRKEEIISDSDILFTKNIEPLNAISIENNYCVIGSAVTVSELYESEIIQQVLPDFNKYIKLISCTSIRNRATIGGNIVNASPIGDLTILFLALQAEIELERENIKRNILLKNLYLGYKKIDLQDDELLISIKFPIPSQQSVFHFEKISRRTHLDIASVNTAVQITVDNNLISEIHLSAGGVAPVPLYLEKTSEFLKNKILNKLNIDEAIEIALTEINPLSDVRGSAEYKTLLFKQLIKSHFITLYPEIL